jgi:serine/threonine protein kinase
VIGLKIGRYEILGELGAGGMGVVYRAHDPVLQRDVALKVLAPHLASDPQARDDFLSEARAAAKLTHPNIVTVYEAGVDNGQVFIAMELVEGGDLRDELERSGRLAPERACAILKGVAEALDHSHNLPQPVIHRDIKPANILLTKEGRPKVADFGIAKVQGDVSRTGTGMLKGTLSYMSPELFEGVKPNSKTDQWSLGVVAYELFSGSHPFIQTNDAPDGQLTIMMRIAKANPPKLLLASPDAKIEPVIDKVIRKAIAREPAHRYESITELSHALLRVTTPSVIQRIPKWIYAVIALLVIATIALAISPRGPYVPPGEYTEKLKHARVLLDTLSSDAATTKLGTSAFTDTYLSSIADIKVLGDQLSGMEVPPSYKAEGLYLKGAASLYQAYDCMAAGNRKGLDEAIAETATAWKQSLQSELSDENRRSAKKGIEQAIVLHRSWKTPIRPSGSDWDWLTTTFEVNEGEIR